MPTARLLLDEHFPPSLAMMLREQGVDVESVIARGELRGQADVVVLQTATAEGRIVVTEDVATFPAAIARVPHHAGVVFCVSSRFRRDPSGRVRLTQALLQFALSVGPTIHQGQVWWLQSPEADPDS